MLRLKFSRFQLHNAIDSHARASLRHPFGAVSPFRINSDGSYGYDVMLP